MTAAGLDPHDEMFDELLSDFLDESAQLIERLNENLLIADQWVRSLAEGPEPCDKELINEMFRSAHSIKGLSAMLGLHEVNRLTHTIENLLDAARRDDLMLTLESVELVFQGVDHLTGMLDDLKAGTDVQPPADDLIHDFERMLSGDVPAEPQASQPQPEIASIESKGNDSAQPPLAVGDIEVAEPEQDNETAAGHTWEEVEGQFAELTDEQELPAKYLAIFIDETDEALDTMTEALLGDDIGALSTVQDLLILAHRIKGSAASVGLNRAAKLAHLMEDLLQELRESQTPLPSALTDPMLRCCDVLRTFVNELRTGTPDTSSFAATVWQLLAAGGQQADDDAPQIPPETSEPAQAADFGQDMTLELWRRELEGKFPAVDGLLAGIVHFEPGLPLAGMKTQLVLDKIAACGELLCSEPPLAGIEDLEEVLTLRWGMSTSTAPNEIERQLLIAGVLRVGVETVTEPAIEAPIAPVVPTIAPLAEACLPTNVPAGPTAANESPTLTAASAAKPSSPPPAPAPAAKPESSKPAETLRVDIERLDQLMNLAGQLVINKARFVQIGEGLKGALSSGNTSALITDARGAVHNLEKQVANPTTDDPQRTLELIQGQVARLRLDLDRVLDSLDCFSTARAQVSELFDAVHQLDRVSDGIQKTIMDTRMVPVGPLFTRFRRVVRDISRSNGKEIDLVIHGEKTELDKRMIDELGDPLIHMVRNSADHGIESPENRIAAGKPRMGQITLNASQRGNSIVIEVSDDGKGMAVEAIQRKALEKGLLSEADLQRMTAHEIYQLIWEPGFSTAEQVTEISGRGMGMDIVRAKIEDLNGKVELTSEPGVGTTFTIRLPLTLAILPSLMAKIDGDVFALPVEAVAEIVQVKPCDLATVHGQMTATVRGRVISVVRLPDLLQWNDGAALPPASCQDDVLLVVFGADGSELGLVVDELLGEEDIVIKSMAENYQNIPGISGASILGDGSVSLILDTLALATMAAKPRMSACV